MKISKLATIGTLAISIAGLSACNNMMPVKDTQVKAPTHSQPMAKMNVVQIAQSNSDFSLLVEALQAADLAGALSDTSASYTILAPTNAAFAALLTKLGITKEELLADKELLTGVLTYHVVPMVVKAADIPYGNAIETANGQTFSISDANVITDASGNSANITATDMTATNGVVHVIDTVLLPK